MINVVYPFVISDWEELRYSLRSLEQYFKEDFEVYIMGDYLPEWITNVKYIETARYINPYEDTGNKLFTATELLEDFIWISDDTFFLKPVTFEDIRYQKIVAERQYSTWPMHIRETVDLLHTLDIGHEVFNYGTHTPRYYESKKLKQLAEQWPMFNGFLNPEFMYYNIFGSKNPEVLNDRLYVRQPKPVIVKPEYKYLNIGNGGLTEKMKDYLAYRFDKQSKFEISEVQDTRQVPEIKLNTYTPEGVWIKYKGKKKNFKYDAYDFSNGPIKVFPEHAKRMIEDYPKTFGLVST